MKLRTQVLSLGLAGAALAAGVGAIGMASSSRLGHAIDSVVGSGQALQLSQMADMMHDAIRGDAQQALLGALEKDPARVLEVEKDLQEHSGNLSEALKTLQSSTLSRESADALAGVLPVAASYLAAASKSVQAAKVDADAAHRQMPEFLAAFSDLETRMAALSEKLHQENPR